MSTIIEDAAARDFKAQVINMVREFQWLTRRFAFKIYGIAYSELPPQSRKAMRDLAREVIDNQIDDIARTEN
ncbi:MAG: hypothetical protein WC554_19580 [Clostridia bacterium]|jgi:hypothetical protein